LTATIKASGSADGLRRPAMRAEKLALALDNDGVQLVADGSDMVTVVATLVDARGTPKTLNNEVVQFSIEGEGRIIGGAEIGANPKALVGGTAPVMVQSTTTAGPIKLHARVLSKGVWTPADGELSFTSVPSPTPAVFNPKELAALDQRAPTAAPTKGSRQRDENALKEVEKQQTDFGHGINDGK